MSIESSTIERTNFEWPGLRSVYHGKVRDVYDLGERLAMVATDRISAFDYILPRAIPYKGQVLNQIASFFLENTKDIVPNWLEATPDPNVSIGVKATAFPVEMVIRGYLSGHAWRTYKSGERLLCGVQMPDGMKENDPFPQPIITPTTKAAHGHDMDISKEAILEQGIVTSEDWAILESYTRALFDRGSEMAKERGLILVDTKYEFGKKDDKIILIDEIHTPDSSRYFYADGYANRQAKGIAQTQLSKEFVREWLIANGFQGLDGQKIPHMDDDFVLQTSQRYIQLYELITGQSFMKADVDNMMVRIQSNVQNYLND
ncbi:MAG: phosphoribosylaminoimidazolesuccinocarboxamide synthase [Chitinophagales bacterium]|nr:phosphoribosylaminoimidazolesuccinocarboxamide synthase [Chitinophagales bacterium]